MTAPRVIDVHTHVIPRRLAESAELGQGRHGITFGRDAAGKITTSVGGLTMGIPWPTPLETPEERVRSMDERGVDVHALSLSPLMHWYTLEPEAAVGLAREANDDVAEMVASQPSRFVGLGFLPLQHPAAAVVELERCVTELGFVGVMVGTNVRGLDWDAPELFPVLEAATRAQSPGVRAPGPGSSRSVPDQISPSESDRQSFGDHDRRGQPHLRGCTRPASPTCHVFRPRRRIRLSRHRSDGPGQPEFVRKHRTSPNCPRSTSGGCISTPSSTAIWH